MMERTPGYGAETRRQEAESAGPDAAAAGNPLLARVVEALKTVYDPEIPVNIYELGLIYGLETTEEGVVHVTMTLTTPACPVAGSLPGEVEAAVRDVDGVHDCEVELVWDPPWTPDMLTEAAKLELGLL